MRKKKPDADKLAAYERGIQARKDAFAKVKARL
jgi:NADH:ubiquinone oxidoreductase subunit 3 (subunit A)